MWSQKGLRYDSRWRKMVTNKKNHRSAEDTALEGGKLSSHFKKWWLITVHEPCQAEFDWEEDTEENHLIAKSSDCFWSAKAVNRPNSAGEKSQPNSPAENSATAIMGNRRASFRSHRGADGQSDSLWGKVESTWFTLITQLFWILMPVR